MFILPSKFLRLWLPFSGILGMISCSSPYPNWVIRPKEIKKAENIQFVFFVEPGSNMKDVSYLISDIFSFMDLLDTYPYLQLEKGLYKIIIYKNYISYRKHRTFSINSLAHFDRDRKYVHIPLLYDKKNQYRRTINQILIRHEMIHALLEQCCEFYPVWLNEGLAFLLQNIHESFRCKKTPIILSKGIYQYKNFLLKAKLHLPYYPDFHQLYSIKEIYIVSSFFVFYLWDQKQLLSLIRTIRIKPDVSLFYIFTRGNWKQYLIQKKKFYGWLFLLPVHYIARGC